MERQSGRILAVDDDRANRLLLARAVQEQGHHVTTAENGQQALALLQAEPFDVVLLDVLMPEMDGYETLARIKEDESLHHLPVIMISAVDEMDSVLRCIEMGATDYLPKPFNQALLRARLNASLAEKRLRDLELEFLEQVNRVVEAAQAVQATTFEPESLDVVACREDALGQLARVFQHMAREVVLREQRLRHQLQQLHLDLDEMKKSLAEPLSAYLPMDRRHALARGEDLPDRTTGAALFADVAGFTPLAAALAEQLGHQRGAEELTRHLNRVYGATIDRVHLYGGSVISFSGDAATCWFDGDDGQRAATCGLEMQRAMEPFASVLTPSGAAVTLTIKVAVVSGPVRRFLVGDPQVNCLDVLAGRTLETLALAEHQSGPGQVIVPAEIIQPGWGAQVTQWVSAEVTGQRFAILSGLDEPVPPSPWPELPATDLADDQCRRWMLPPVYRRLGSGATQFLAELRPATTLFLGFEGIDYDADDQAEAKLDAYIRWVQSHLERYEGVLTQLNIGDKGSYLCAGFGAPVAHHDDEVRAVSAALALQAPPPELDYIRATAIGLSQGQTRVGPYGSTTRRIYGLQGDKVNLAARLMQAARALAPGGARILCDSTVHQAAQSRLVFDPLPPIQVKGQQQPIALFRPTGEKRRVSRKEARLLGRTAERVQLRQALQDQIHGASPIVILEGEAGIGKTRLLEELRVLATEMGLATLTVAGDVAHKAQPYRAWRTALQKLCGLAADAVMEHQAAQVVRQLEEHGEDRSLAPLLNPVLSLEIPDGQTTSSLSEQARIDQTRELLVALMRERWQSPARALFVENGQDLDPASWRLLLAVSQAIQPLLLVIASRPLAEPLPTGYTQIQRSAHRRTLPLKALSSEETYLLACDHLGVVSLPRAVSDLLPKTGGNPLVIEELVYQLRDEGYLIVEAGRCQVAAGASLTGFAFPTTAQNVITSRFDRLSPPEQMTLKVASVIGHTFDRQLLYDVHPVTSDRAHLDRHLKALERLDLIVHLAPAPTYAFKSLLTQETAYNAMLYAQRRLLHRQVAEWYEMVHRDDLASHHATLAHHWRQADEPSKAVHYLEMASQQARQTGAHREAERYLEESLQIEAEAGVLSSGYYDKPPP